MESWLKFRPRYLRSKRTRKVFRKSAEDKRVFPYEFPAALMMWKTACSKAGFDQRDKSTNRWEVHPHVLRKYFRSKLSEVIPVDIVEALMGHEGYLTEVYRRHGEKDLAKYYHRGEEKLLIFAQPEGDVLQLRELLQGRIDELTINLKKLDGKVKKYETFTRRWMEMSPDELEQIGMEIRKRREREIREVS